MSELITGKEAKLAWANGDVVEYYEESRDAWFEIRGNTFVSVFDNRDKFRLKPRTITINGIEVPAPFEPKEGETYWCFSTQTVLGYGHNVYESEHVDRRFINMGAWRTENEIKQVITALRKIFND